MLTQIHKLYDIANLPSRKILGLMSGTSLDGLDLALVTCYGAGERLTYSLNHFASYEYDSIFRNEVLKVFSQKIGDIQLLTILHSHIADVHLSMIYKAMSDWGISLSEIDLISSHGQTMYHAPISLHKDDTMPNASLQLGDADRIASKTGIITISDLRQREIAYGGEGAPMAKYGDFLMYRSDIKNRILINLGGIANFTWLPKSASLHQLVSTDSGPANGIMNAYMRHTFDKAFDNNGDIASTGNVNGNFLLYLLSHPFLSLPIPKTTGPEIFNFEWIAQYHDFHSMSPNDIMASLNLFSAMSITDCIQNCTDEFVDEVLLSGGGIYNPVLIQNIRNLMPHSHVQVLEEGNAKESIFFALFANELVAGANEKINFGKISLP